MTSQGRGEAAIFYHKHRNEEYQPKEKEKLPTRGTKKKAEMRVHIARDGKEILVLVLHESQLHALPLGPKRNPVLWGQAGWLTPIIPALWETKTGE